jgi:hypothetical protein
MIISSGFGHGGKRPEHGFEDFIDEWYNIHNKSDAGGGVRR